MSIFVPIFMAALVGIFLSVQTGVNMQLQQHWALAAAPAALASLSIGALTTLAYILITRTPVPPLPGTTSIWHWTGGVLGSYTVIAMILLAPRLGMGTLTAVVLAAQLGSALVLDHYGLIGFATRDFTWQRLLGLALMIGGVIMIQKY